MFKPKKLLRQALKQAHSGIENQLGKLTECPTLRWIFQCFQAIQLYQLPNVCSDSASRINFHPLTERIGGV